MYSTKALSIKQDKTGITIDYNEDIVINYLLDFLTTKDIHYTNKNNSIHITCDISETLIDFHKKHKLLPKNSNKLKLELQTEVPASTH